MHLSLACTQCLSSLLFFFLSAFISLCSSVSLPLWAHRSATVLLCAQSLSYAAQGPPWGPSLGSPTKQRRWRYQNVARRLSARIGPGWPSGLLVDACPCQAPSAFPAWTSAVCGKSCGVCLRLHLNPPSPRLGPCLAERAGISVLALLVLIALAWLAVCFWLHSLISIPQEATTTVAAFRRTHTHTHDYTDSFPHAYTDRHECIFVWTQPCICFVLWDSQHSLNWFLHLSWQNLHNSAIMVQDKGGVNYQITTFKCVGAGFWPMLWLPFSLIHHNKSIFVLPLLAYLIAKTPPLCHCPVCRRASF